MNVALFEGSWVEALALLRTLENRNGVQQTTVMVSFVSVSFPFYFNFISVFFSVLCGANLILTF